MRNGVCIRLPLLMLPTSGTGSSWWPTPAARDWHNDKRLHIVRKASPS
jgi:hypothetical protein